MRLPKFEQRENLWNRRRQKLEIGIFTVHVMSPTLKPDCVSECGQLIYGKASSFLRESFIISSTDAKDTLGTEKNCQPGYITTSVPKSVANLRKFHSVPKIQFGCTPLHLP